MTMAISPNRFSVPFGNPRWLAGKSTIEFDDLLIGTSPSSLRTGWQKVRQGQGGCCEPRLIFEGTLIY